MFYLYKSNHNPHLRTPAGIHISPGFLFIYFGPDAFATDMGVLRASSRESSVA